MNELLVAIKLYVSSCDIANQPTFFTGNITGTVTSEYQQTHLKTRVQLAAEEVQDRKNLLAEAQKKLDCAKATDKLIDIAHRGKCALQSDYVSVKCEK